MLIFCMTSEATMVENTFIAGRPRLASISDDVIAMRGITFLYWSAFSVWHQALDHVMQYDYFRDTWDDVARSYDEYRRDTDG